MLGQTIYGIEITHDVNTTSGKPVFMMTGLHHAREWPTVELTMEFIYDILKNDGVDPRFTSLLDSVRFIAVPVVNADGYVDDAAVAHDRAEALELQGRGRKNPDVCGVCGNPANARAGVDLNRNYGAFWGGSGANVNPSGDSHRGAAPFSEPEIQNMRELLASNQVVVALSNHTPDAKVLRVPSANEEPVPADVVPYDSLAHPPGNDLKRMRDRGRRSTTRHRGRWRSKPTIRPAPLRLTFENQLWDSRARRKAFIGSYRLRGRSILWAPVHIRGRVHAPAFSSARVRSRGESKVAFGARSESALAGATLTIHKSFTMETSPLLNSDAAGDSTRSAATQVYARAELIARRSEECVDQVIWHVNPSRAGRCISTEREFIRESVER